MTQLMLSTCISKWRQFEIETLFLTFLIRPRRLVRAFSVVTDPVCMTTLYIM